MRALTLVYGVVCYFIFFATFLYLVGFIADIPQIKGIDDGEVFGLARALPVNIALMLVFGLQHSIMARPGFKAVWTRIVPKPIERSTYVLAASLALMLLFWQWRPMPTAVWEADAVWLVALLWAVFLAGVLLVLLSTFVINHFDLFGLRQVWLEFRAKPYSDLPFRVTWFYRFVRHPLYVGFLLALWSAPRMSQGHLLLSIGLTIYILIAIQLEERDLVAGLGQSYRDYQARVPMLIPRPGAVHETVRPQGGRTVV